ncbi:hypothetical protein J6590_078905 [Homalodisca vitripennis]|nr:hypothetical protein J6590_078905 [Homalodisca vitripennis]
MSEERKQKVLNSVTYPRFESGGRGKLNFSSLGKRGDRPPLFCPSSWATGLCEDLIKQNMREIRYSTKSTVLITSVTVTDRIRTCAISNSDLKSNVLDRSAIGTPGVTIQINSGCHKDEIDDLNPDSIRWHREFTKQFQFERRNASLQFSKARLHYERYWTRAEGGRGLHLALKSQAGQGERQGSPQPSRSPLIFPACGGRREFRNHGNGRKVRCGGSDIAGRCGYHKWKVDSFTTQILADPFSGKSVQDDLGRSRNWVTTKNWTSTAHEYSQDVNKLKPYTSAAREYSQDLTTTTTQHKPTTTNQNKTQHNQPTPHLPYLLEENLLSRSAETNPACLDQSILPHKGYLDTVVLTLYPLEFKFQPSSV